MATDVSYGHFDGDGKADFLCDDANQSHWMLRNGIGNTYAPILHASGYPYFYLSNF